MKKKLLTLLGVTLLVGCECADKKEDMSMSGESEVAGGLEPGSAGDFTDRVQDRVYFAFDSSELVPEARKTLEAQSAWIKQYPNVQVTVSGYCDKRGSIQYNDGLGERRAKAAAGYLSDLLKEADVNKEIKTVSYGNRVTLVEGDSEEDYALNRTAITTID